MPGALGELRDAGWRLALLTNCDRDIIGAHPGFAVLKPRQGSAPKHDLDGTPTVQQLSRASARSCRFTSTRSQPSPVTAPRRGDDPTPA